jgi:predicted nuclease with TOPRIM domain
MTVKEREQKSLLRECKKKCGSRDVNDMIDNVERDLSNKRFELKELEGKIYDLEDELSELKTIQKATCEIKKPMAKHTERPKTERKLSMFFGE